jgi:large subunit ribosomal protein L32
MPVPKKRLSKSKKNSRKAMWYKNAFFNAKKAFSLGKSVLTEKSTSFIILSKNKEDKK